MRTGCVVDRVDRDLGSHRTGRQRAIADGVGELVGTEIVRLRPIRESSAIEIERRRAQEGYEVENLGKECPLVILRYFGRDPAMGGSVLLTFTTDSGGFLIFLGLATFFFAS